MSNIKWVAKWLTTVTSIGIIQGIVSVFIKNLDVSYSLPIAYIVGWCLCALYITIIKVRL